MKKKILTVILVILCLIASAFCLTACADNKGNGSGSELPPPSIEDNTGGNTGNTGNESTGGNQGENQDNTGNENAGGNQDKEPDNDDEKDDSINSLSFTYLQETDSYEVGALDTAMGIVLYKSEIVIPSEYKGKKVTRIREGAFRECNVLESIVIPHSVTSIGDGAFLECSGLKSIEVEQGNTKYHSSGNCIIETESKTLIAGCKNSIIPSDGSVTSIGSYAFHKCSSFTSIEIPSGVQSIGNSAFHGCSNLTSIEIPSSVTCIGDSAFYGCSSLTSIEIPSGVTSIGDDAFIGCFSLSSIEIPSSVTNIGDGAFHVCSRLAIIRYTGDIKSWCSITGLYNLMCYGTADRKLYIDGQEITGELIIPDGITSIGEFAFNGCKSIISVELPCGLQNIEVGAFFGCSALERITVASGNERYHSSGNCLIETASKMLILGCKNSIIPSDGSVTSIGGSAFYGCSNLTSIEIPSRVIKIWGSAFNGCDNLIQTEDGVCYVGKWAVDCDSKLTAVTLRADTVGIADGLFLNCSKLKSVVIPSSVKTIGEYTFNISINEPLVINYCGTKSQWDDILKFCRYITGNYTINYDYIQ